MASGWTPSENAVYIRGAVQIVQHEIGYPVYDGKYTRGLHEAVRAAFVDAGLQGEADRLDDQGPAIDVLLPDLSRADAYAFRVAWAWWAKLRGKPPYPSNMLNTINDWNEFWSDGGPLTIDNAKDLDLFVGDGQSGTTTSRKLALVVGGTLGVLAFGYMGVSYGRSRCPHGHG